MMTMKRRARGNVTGDVSEKTSQQYITATERYSRPPARYTEASLVKKLKS
jgi:DNA topoisomerase IA